jgi:hypothetical protein
MISPLNRHLPVLVSTLLALLTAIAYVYLNYLMINEEVDLLLFSLFKRVEAFCGCPWSLLVSSDHFDSLDSSFSTVRSTHDLLSTRSPPRDRDPEEGSQKSTEFSSRFS